MKTKELISLTIIMVVILSCVGCKKEGCTDPTAINYSDKAKKNDGSCEYALALGAEYIGNYVVSDSLFMFGTFDHITNYTLNVSTGGPGSDTLYFSNFWGDGATYYALISGTSFNIPSQQVSGPYYATGSGNFNGNNITYQTSGDVYINRGTGAK